MTAPRHPLETSLTASWPCSLWAETRQLVAVSGGADSVALLRGLMRVAPQPGWIDVAHFNHAWRGAASDADEAFVRELCDRWQVRLFVGRLTSPKSSLSAPASSVTKSEETARDDRYRFLTQTAYQCGARYVLTAHTADDRVETMLHNLFRGTGLAGVSAPSLTRPLDQELILARPLLACSRAVVEDYLGSLQQDYRVDASNSDVSYARNRLRHQLLPLVREAYGPQVDARLLSFSHLAEEAVETLRGLAANYLQQIERMAPPTVCSALGQPGDFCFPDHHQLAIAWPVLHQALIMVWQARGWPLQSMSREHWELVRQRHVTAGGAPVVTLPGGLQMQALDGWLVIRAPQQP